MTEPAPSQPDVPGSATPEPGMPDYKGAPLDSERGPGLGCFWFQVGLLVALLILTPLSVLWAWPSEVSAALLILSLVLLFFVGQTMIFLLRLVAADRRSRRRPLAPAARRTVGQLEDESADSKRQIGDVVRIVQSPETVATGYAGRTGLASGWTTPTVTGVDVIGSRDEDIATGVTFDDGTTAWFDPSLVAPVDPSWADESEENHSGSA